MDHFSDTKAQVQERTHSQICVCATPGLICVNRETSLMQPVRRCVDEQIKVVCVGVTLIWTPV